MSCFLRHSGTGKSISVGKSSLVMANQAKWKRKRYSAIFMFSADKTSPRSWAVGASQISACRQRTIFNFGTKLPCVH